MEKIIKIDIPEGKVAKQTINSDGSISISFVDKEPIRSKSWEEFCENHPIVLENEYYFCDDSSIRSTQSRKYDKTPRRFIDKIFLSSKEDAEGVLALIQLTRLHDEWVGDWKPRFRADPNAAIINTGNKLEVSVSCYCSALLLFPNKELAEEFLKCFKDLIEKAKKFI